MIEWIISLVWLEINKVKWQIYLKNMDKTKSKIIIFTPER